ncbi:hypothetical protein NK8_04630 [Caballeronia sp. NK8]|nr:hypothetical protein NK8_04630 [Caballeronia sp. NK8]
MQTAPTKSQSKANTRVGRDIRQAVPSMAAGKLISMPERDFITELAKEPQKSLGYIIRNLAARHSWSRLCWQ